ncbi:MAG: glycosyltransferase family 2 protein [bacterium]
MKLTIIIPVYNEVDNIKKILESVQDVDLGNIAKEIIIVDDGSTDGSRDMLKDLDGKENIKVLYHKQNQGKGSAIKTGLKAVNGDFVIVQDADLEYDPSDYKELLGPILENKADVVYGSRFLNAKNNRFLSFSQYWGNKFITFTTNCLFDVHITDVETCYKLFRREVISDIDIKSRHFDMETEITAKILKKKRRLVEKPIKYNARGYKMGKKIHLIDGFAAIWALVKYKFLD